jgi:hypothetical protein
MSTKYTYATGVNGHIAVASSYDDGDRDFNDVAMFSRYGDCLAVWNLDRVADGWGLFPMRSNRLGTSLFGKATFKFTASSWAEALRKIAEAYNGYEIQVTVAEVRA